MQLKIINIYKAFLLESIAKIFTAQHLLDRLSGEIIEDNIDGDRKDLEM
jgi:hypothetical protein